MILFNTRPSVTFTVVTLARRSFLHIFIVMSVNKVILCSFLCVALFSCQKKNDPPVDEPQPDPAPPTVVSVDSNFLCGTLPPTPGPFGWTDSTSAADQNVVAFTYDPLDPDRLIYIAKGDVSAYNLIRSRNLVSGSTADMGNAGEFLPSINKKGWMVYSNADYNIIKVKTNGDSMRTMLSFNLHMDPVWDYSGNYFFYFQNPTQSIASQIMRMSADGSLVRDAFFADLPHMASYNLSDKLIYLQTGATEVTLVERDMKSSDERKLIRGPYNPRTGQVHFNNMCVDRNDLFLYWTNHLGLFRCNLATLKVDTIKANCQNFVVDGPMMSFRNNEITFSKHEMKALTPLVLYHRYRPVEMDLLSGKTKFTDIFPN